MDELLREQIPHAPQMGLFVAPDIPDQRLTNALADYAHYVERREVLALYDATLSGNAKDGAVFAVDRFIFQNTDLEAPQTVRYRNLVGLELKQRWFGIAGKKIELTLRRGPSTLTQTMDFSGQPEAAEYVATFLQAALHRSPPSGSSRSTPREKPSAPSVPQSQKSSTPAETDIRAVRRTLERLHAKGKLSASDLERLVATLRQTEES